MSITDPSQVTTRRDLLELAGREEFIDIDVIVRALQVSRRKLLRALKSKNVPFVRVGHSVRIRSDLVVACYYPDKSTPPVIPVISDHNDQIG